MNKILHDLSGKIEQSAIRVLLIITEITERLHLDFILVGATARDILIEHLHKIKAPRMTKDIDIAVCVASWKEYDTLAEALLADGKFLKHAQKQRFVFEGTLIDIIPFGDISGRNNRISWPPEHETVFSTIGFIDVFNNSITFRLNRDPVLDIQAPTIPGLAIVKLLAWNDGYPDRQKDAEDLFFIMRAYQNAGIEDRLYGQEAILLEEERFDNERAGIRLLGRDMAKISNRETADEIKRILDLETGLDSKYRLVHQMRDNIHDADFILFILEKLKQGFSEGTSS